MLFSIAIFLLYPAIVLRNELHCFWSVSTVIVAHYFVEHLPVVDFETSECHKKPKGHLTNVLCLQLSSLKKIGEVISFFASLVVFFMVHKQIFKNFLVPFYGQNSNALRLWSLYRQTIWVWPLTPRSFFYVFDWPWNSKKLSWLWNYPLVLNLGALFLEHLSRFLSQKVHYNVLDIALGFDVVLFIELHSRYMLNLLKTKAGKKGSLVSHWQTSLILNSILNRRPGGLFVSHIESVNNYWNFQIMIVLVLKFKKEI